MAHPVGSSIHHVWLHFQTSWPGASPRNFGWGGGRIHRHPTPPILKNQFLLGFRSLYFENVGKCKFFIRFKEKRYWNIQISAGVDPAVFQKCEGRDPRDPPPPLPPSTTPLFLALAFALGPNNTKYRNSPRRFAGMSLMSNCSFSALI